MFLPWLLGQPDSKQDAIYVLVNCPRRQGKDSFADYRFCKIAGIFANVNDPLKRELS
jgi:hypothetical protein